MEKRKKKEQGEREVLLLDSGKICIFLIKTFESV